MKDILSKNTPFLLPTASFILILGIVLLVSDKVNTQLYINDRHSPLGDVLFQYITHLGSGWIVLPICIILLFFRFQYTLMVLLSYGITSAIAQGLKHFVFNDALRPKGYFESTTNEGLNFIEGVDIHYYNSMPSGHTATAFCVFCMLAFIIPDKRWGLVFAFFAMLAGLSRAYLNQHFLEDIFVGAIIGTLTSVLVYWFMRDKGERGFLSRSLRS